MLWCVIYGQAVFGPLFLQELCELSASILPSVVGLKPLDACAMLCVGPHCEHPVSLQGLILRL